MQKKLDPRLTDIGLRLSGPASGKNQIYTLPMIEIVGAGRFLSDNFEPATEPFTEMNSFELSRAAAQWCVDNDVNLNGGVLTNSAILQASINAGIEMQPALYPGLNQTINVWLFIQPKPALKENQNNDQ